MKKILLLAMFASASAFAQVPPGAQWFCGTMQAANQAQTQHVNLESAIAVLGAEVFMIWDPNTTPPTYWIYKGTISSVQSNGLSGTINVRIKNSESQIFNRSTLTFGAFGKIPEWQLRDVTLGPSSLTYSLPYHSFGIHMEATQSDCATSTMRSAL